MLIFPFTDSPFNQQQLPAWQPILTAGTVLPTFFVIGIAFVAIGSGLLYFSNRVLEYHVDYTDCKNNVGDHCWNVTLHQNFTEECKCEVKIEVTEDMEKPVFMYYGLTNFYQNHRRYVKSRDEKQLLGNIEAEPTDDCDPYKQDKETGKFIVPCGAIANSLFNDEIVLKKDGKAVTLLNTGIAWESDKKYKFKNPELPEGVTLEACKISAVYVLWHFTYILFKFFSRFEKQYSQAKRLEKELVGIGSR